MRRCRNANGSIGQSLLSGNLVLLWKLYHTCKYRNSTRSPTLYNKYFERFPWSFNFWAPDSLSWWSCFLHKEKRQMGIPSVSQFTAASFLSPLTMEKGFSSPQRPAALLSLESLPLSPFQGFVFLVLVSKSCVVNPSLFTRWSASKCKHWKQSCAGDRCYWFVRTKSENLFPTSHPVISRGYLEINSCESIYTAEIGQRYKSGLFL